MVGSIGWLILLKFNTTEHSLVLLKRRYVLVRMALTLQLKAGRRDGSFLPRECYRWVLLPESFYLTDPNKHLGIWILHFSGFNLRWLLRPREGEWLALSHMIGWWPTSDQNSCLWVPAPRCLWSISCEHSNSCSHGSENSHPAVYNYSSLLSLAEKHS